MRKSETSLNEDRQHRQHNSHSLHSLKVREERGSRSDAEVMGVILRHCCGIGSLEPPRSSLPSVGYEQPAYARNLCCFISHGQAHLLSWLKLLIALVDLPYFVQIYMRICVLTLDFGEFWQGMSSCVRLFS